MRTTVTLDPDTESLVRRLMAERGVSFKQALNDAIRGGAHPAARQFSTRTRSMGVPAVGLDRALQLAGEDEDRELIRRMRAGQ
ncbi:MAG: antitoxin [Microbacteriaceae bacterium]|nr:antitoxin [Microbacteriaceae bacterium]